MLVTQSGVTPSQPTVFVAFNSPVYSDDTESTIIAGARLSVHRTYNQLTNEFGSKGRSKYLDGNGKLFATLQEARQWAFEHGYLQPYFRTYDPARKAERKLTYLKFKTCTNPPSFKSWKKITPKT